MKLAPGKPYERQDKERNNCEEGNPHKLGVHKVLQHIPLNALFDAPYQAALKKAVNIADLRLIAKSRAPRE